MGLPALQQFEHLSAAVEARSDDAARAGEVVSFSLGDLMKSVSGVIADMDSLRLLMIEGRLALNEVTDDGVRGESIEKMARVRVALKRLARTIARPMLARPTGHSLVKLAEVLEEAKPRLIADARIMRKLARRVREHAERCEQQRIRFHAQSISALEVIERVATQGEQSARHEEAYLAALITATRDRHPVINAYLAR